MSPSTARRHRAVLEQRLLLDTYFGNDPEALALVLDAVDKAIVLMAQPVIFRWIGQEGRQNVFEVGSQGGEVRTVRTSCRAIWWLWAAIDDRQRTTSLRAADFSAPWACASDDSARKCLRNGCSRTLRHWGLPELGVAAKSITVRAGVIAYDPPANAPVIVTSEKSL